MPQGTFIRVVLLLLALADPPAKSPAVPPDYKVRLAFFGAGADPLATGELVVHNGVAYQFLSETRSEVQILDPVHDRVVLLDLKHKLQTELDSKALTDHTARLRRTLEGVIARTEKSDDRSERVSAAMGRDLLGNGLRETLDPSGRSIRLANATVEVRAQGEPDDVPGRARHLGGVLNAVARLGSLRDPQSLPPFARTEALDRLTAGRNLRPTELSVLYRLAGTPVRMRWTYTLAPAVTDREREAIRRVDALRAVTRFVPWDRYESLE